MPRTKPLDLTLISREINNIDGTNYYVYKYKYHAMNGDVKYKTVKRKYTPKLKGIVKVEDLEISSDF